MARAIEATQFAQLRAHEDANGFAERSEHQERFFRAGRVGGWREVLTAEQAGRIGDAHGKVMEVLGYDC